VSSEKDMGHAQRGVASLNYSSRIDGQIILSFLSMNGDDYFIEWLYVKDGVKIEQSLEKWRTMVAGMKLSRPEGELSLKDVTSHVSQLLNLLLYICQVNSEYRDVRNADGSNTIPGNPRPKKTKKGLRYFSPDNPTIWECGMRQGSELRRALSQQTESMGGTHRSPAPHTRLAHWQTYIVGEGSRKNPSKGQRVLKWIRTILVNARKGDAVVPVIREVD
jgi:hypothetical protein